ncbi:MAG: cell division protein ZapA [Alphaproteobacteria bacterium]|nr:cell division protein ZapA [Alphaproteobacteria bacterium]
MAVVEVAINGRSYQVACDDGQEEHLKALGRELDDRVKELARGMGQVGDARLILMAGLLIADELGETREQMSALKRGAEDERAKAERRAADDLAGLAKRLESVAARLDSR